MHARSRILALALSAWAMTASPVAAQEPTRWWRISTLAGATYLDASLDDYRWDVSGTPSFGLQAEAGWRRWSAGLRASRATTHQATGLPGEGRPPSVRLSALEATGAVLARGLGLETSATLHGGWLHLGYSPDRLVLDAPVGGSAIEVAFSPIDEWTVGAELGVRRTLASGLALGLHLDRSWFWLDTSHRNGTDIEERRERFGNWTVRAQLSWTWARL